jgi:hypothetical protein
MWMVKHTFWDVKPWWVKFTDVSVEHNGSIFEAEDCLFDPGDEAAGSCETFSRLHDITYQKAVLFKVSAVKTSSFK